MATDMKNQLDQLVQEHQQLKEENALLSEEIRRLRGQAAIGTGTPGSPAPSTGTPTPPRRETTAPPPSGAQRTHTVQRGDTFYSIARRYNISQSALEAANPGVNANRLGIGQQLVVPTR